jgi:hypothetical protein
VDRLTAAIDRLPGPYWLVYLISFLAMMGLIALVRRPAGIPVTLESAFNNSIPFYFLWLFHYLNRKASNSLNVFAPAFTGGQADLQGVRWRLTTIPARPALLVTLGGLLVSVAISLPWEQAAPDWLIDRMTWYATGVVAGLFAFHTIRQLREVSSLYAGRAQVDIHNVAPLYSFSTLSAHSAIGISLVLSAAILITPSGVTGWFVPLFAIFVALAVVTFLLPLAGAHRRLTEEKEQALTDNARRWQACTTELYRLVDRADWDGANRLNATLTALERGRVAIERIPTWPWRPETLRTVVGALVLPVVIWLVQFGLERLLG